MVSLCGLLMSQDPCERPGDLAKVLAIEGWDVLYGEEFLSEGCRKEK